MDPQSGPQSGPPNEPHYGPPSNGVNSFESSNVNIRNQLISKINIEQLDNTSMFFVLGLRPTLPTRQFQSAKTGHARWSLKTAVKSSFA